jgi:hypothetical protein
VIITSGGGRDDRVSDGGGEDSMMGSSLSVEGERSTAVALPLPFASVESFGSMKEGVFSSESERGLRSVSATSGRAEPSLLPLTFALASLLGFRMTSSITFDLEAVLFRCFVYFASTPTCLTFDLRAGDLLLLAPLLTGLRLGRGPGGEEANAKLSGVVSVTDDED